MAIRFPVAISTFVSDKANRSAFDLYYISDRQFIDTLNRLRKLKRFLFDEKVQISPDQLAEIDLAALNNYRYSASGRPPNEAEWSKLDTVFSTVISHLDSNLKRKVRILELRKFFNIIPLIFLFTVVLATFVYINLESVFGEYGTPWFNMGYTLVVIIWALSQGGLGACAFLGTSVIMKSQEEARTTDPQKNQERVPFELSDITDRNFLQVRVLLGALFGFLFGVTIGNFSLGKIEQAFVHEGADKLMHLEDMPIILIPFLIGFSTNLVLVLLHRIVSVIQTLFGVQTRG